jgi:hypothetical protein
MEDYTAYYLANERFYNPDYISPWGWVPVSVSESRPDMAYFGTLKAASNAIEEVYE